jgi:hypothetical protein
MAHDGSMMISTARIMDLVDHEGIYAALEFVPAGKVADQPLARLWANVELLVAEIEGVLDQYRPKEERRCMDASKPPFRKRSRL